MTIKKCAAIFRETCAALLVTLLAAANVGALGAEPPLKSIAESWNVRQEAIRSIEYRVAGTWTVVKGGYNGMLSLAPPQSAPANLPDDDHTFEVQLTLQVDLEHRWFRKDCRREICLFNVPRFVKSRSLWLFDGERYCLVDPKEDNPQWDFKLPEYHAEISIVPPEMGAAFVEVTDYPLLFALGAFPNLSGAMTPRQLRHEIDIQSLSLHGRGVIDERPQVVMRTKPVSVDQGDFHEYWIDIDHQCTVTRWVKYVAGQIASKCDIQYSLEGELLMPRRWKGTDLTDGKIREFQDMVVTHVAVNPQFERRLFQAAPSTGAVVADHVAEETYILGNEGQRQNIDDAIAEAVTEREALSAFRRVVLLILSLSALASVAGWWLFRRKTQRG